MGLFHISFNQQRASTTTCVHGVQIREGMGCGGTSARYW